MLLVSVKSLIVNMIVTYHNFFYFFFNPRSNAVICISFVAGLKHGVKKLQENLQRMEDLKCCNVDSTPSLENPYKIC